MMQYYIYKELSPMRCQSNLRLRSMILKHIEGEPHTFLLLAFILRTQQSLANTGLNTDYKFVGFHRVT